MGSNHIQYWKLQFEIKKNVNVGLFLRGFHIESPKQIWLYYKSFKSTETGEHEKHMKQHLKSFTVSVSTIVTVWTSTILSLWSSKLNTSLVSVQCVCVCVCVCVWALLVLLWSRLQYFQPLNAALVSHSILSCDFLWAVKFWSEFVWTVYMYICSTCQTGGCTTRALWGVTPTQDQPLRSLLFSVCSLWPTFRSILMQIQEVTVFLSWTLSCSVGRDVDLCFTWSEKTGVCYKEEVQGAKMEEHDTVNLMRVMSGNRKITQMWLWNYHF